VGERAGAEAHAVKSVAWRGMVRLRGLSLGDCRLLPASTVTRPGSDYPVGHYTSVTFKKAPKGAATGVPPSLLE